MSVRSALSASSDERVPCDCGTSLVVRVERYVDDPYMDRPRRDR
jgi:hypothetical protein